MINKPEFISELDFELLKKKYKSEKQLEKIIERIKKNYPVQYAIGNVEFLDNVILVDERVLIPRFETEHLVSKLTEYIESFSLDMSNMLDLCTGSGCISIALKARFNGAEVFAIDKSKKALVLAKKNARINDVKIKFRYGNVLSNIPVKEKFSVLISNPPYVKLDEKVTPNTKFEPRMALYPGSDDIIFYKRILDQSALILTEKNIIAFEIGSTQAKRISEYAKKIYPHARISIQKDYGGYDRFLFIFNNCE